MTELHRLLWAKSAPKDRPDNWKPVLAHLLDVAACAWEILELEPPSTLNQYAADLGYPLTEKGRDTARRWLCALIALHDLGKASPAFEQQWPDWPAKQEAAARGLSWKTGRDGPSRTPLNKVVSHSLISQATLPELLEKKGWNRRIVRQLADAVGAHHGFRANDLDLNKARRPKERGEDAWDRVRRELFDAVCSVLDVPPPSHITRFPGGPYMRLAGLTSFADWIGSSFELEKFQHAQLDDPRAYLADARALARQKLAEIDWQPRTPLITRPRSFAETFPFPPRPLQLGAETMLDGVSAPTLLLVEAPMGEGKTELALFAHLSLQRQLGHRGLYIALPTQATGNAMFRRTAKFLEAFGGRPLDLQLLHGGKELSRDFQELRLRPNTPAPNTTRNVPDAPQEEIGNKTEAQRNISAREWFTVRKRALLSEYGVGTVDQALLGVLPVAHQFIRLWGLGNRVVVLDEVHAYDVYTGHLIEELVKWLHALGSSVILMSATLPRARREALMRAYGAIETPEAGYPRLTRVSGGAAQSLSVQADASRKQSIELHGLSEGMEAVTARALDLHAGGGITAVIVNTVQRAQQVRQALAKAGVPDDDILLFHARLRNKDRREKETQVLKKLGKEGERPPRLILLGTQVLEQSLDYDADVMLTDLAPLDLILQRAGRLHRHKRPKESRAAYAQPALHIAGLTDSLPNFKDTYWGRIYQPWTLLRAWAILGRQGRIELPGQLDELVQWAYQNADPDGLTPEARGALADARLRKKTDDDKRHNAGIHAAIASPAHFPGGEAKDPRWDDDPGSDDDEAGDEDRPTAGTRLGEQSVTVVPLFLQGGVLRLDPDGKAAPLTKRDFGDGEQKTNHIAAVHECSLRLSRWEVLQKLPAHARSHVAVKLHWPELAALRDALPLVLEEQGGRWLTDLGGLSVEYDLELGVVYEKP